MYRSCIFCSSPLGSNEAVEEFQVGNHLAFDAGRGRLWAVCSACGRWNLAPIEERWEAVEHAERLFRNARLRVQSENIGLAKLSDGTRLVRVGEALPGELAAWRYGGQLLHRRKRYVALSGVGAVASLGVWGGLTALGVGLGTVVVGWSVFQTHMNQRVVYRLAESEGLGGRSVTIRRWHISGMRLLSGKGMDDIRLEIRDASREKPKGLREGPDAQSDDILVCSGAPARALLERAMLRLNKAGATRASLREADRILSQAGSAEGLIQEAAAGMAALGSKAGKGAEVLKGPSALALEMALHEESERRALEGELERLKLAWQEAEEIAAIADLLPGEETINTFLNRLIR